MTDEEPIPYLRNTRDEYAVTASRSFSLPEFVPSQEKAAIVLLSGPCPECKHKTLGTYPIKVYALEATDKRKMEVTVRCECGVHHPGRPDDEKGCGRYWKMIVEW